tara:strand:- start:1576 stop:2577 length:1002 start_codon:yes stop_codon:yes gene_type:complete
MNIEYKLALYFSIATLLSIFLYPFLIRLSNFINLKDGPKKQKRISNKSVPLVGGIAIFTLFWVLLFLFLPSDSYYYLFFLTGAIFLIGLIDDFFDLRPLIKFSLPFFVCILSVLLGIQIEIFTHTIVNITFSFIWIYGLTNSINFLDNMDGVSSGVLLVKSLFIMLFTLWSNQYELALIFSFLLGLNLVFLYYNFNPAKIYLGDSGSLFQGFLLSVLLIKIEWDFQSDYSRLFAPILFAGYTILDTSYVFFSRIVNGVRPWIGDTNHTSHKLLKLGFTVKQSSLIIYGITSAFCLSGFLIYFLDVVISFLIIVLNFILIIKYIMKLNEIPYEH